ncbi:MAG: YraN family protein [Clostridia bacterium]|nr:YraN family protein [Clostridia bacterium]
MKSWDEIDFTKVKNKAEGLVGELSATDFLRSKGYKIVQTNFKTKFGEIDIIALYKGVIVFVEVKNRSTLAYGRPIEAVDWRKQQKIRCVAEFYLMNKKKSEADVRFDIIEIVGDSINHVENAF